MSKATEIREHLGVTRTIKLNMPVKLANGRELSELTVRRAKVGDYRATAHCASEVEQEIMLLARLAGLVAEDVEELDLSDYKQLQDWFRLCQEKPKAENETRTQ